MDTIKYRCTYRNFFITKWYECSSFNPAGRKLSKTGDMPVCAWTKRAQTTIQVTWLKDVFQVLFPSEMFLTHGTRKRMHYAISVQLHLQRTLFPVKISYTHHLRKGALHYVCVNGTSMHIATWKIYYTLHMKMGIHYREWVCASSGHSAAWKIPCKHCMRKDAPVYEWTDAHSMQTATWKIPYTLHICRDVHYHECVDVSSGNWAGRKICYTHFTR